MREAATVLDVLRERGRRGLPLERLYRQLFNPQLYLLAYGRLYSNKGAMTPGPDSETVDGMSLDKIGRIIDALRYERYRFKPVRRTYIPKKKNGKKRPLGLPTWSDKLVGEVVRLLLEAYYEPQFSDLSYGFRPKRGCHTALSEITNRWTGTTWFIEGDIADCFGSLDHKIMLSRLAGNIHDGRFLRLLRNMLQAGFLEDWIWHNTLSGAPQGGVASPILSNIYLDRLDSFVEKVLIPEYTRGISRTPNPAYQEMEKLIVRARRRGDRPAVRALRQQRRSLPSKDPTDPGFRRLRYARYCDDHLLGFTGPKAEAEEIKTRLAAFLRDELKLELSRDKTLITHARTGAARFLGYEIIVQHADHKVTGTRRSINGTVGLRVPRDVIKAKSAPYLKLGKPERLNHMVNEDDHTIVRTYGAQYRGLVEYYLLAGDVYRLNRLEGVMKTSMLKTLACKHDSTVTQMADRYKTTIATPYGPRRCFEVSVEREGRKPLIARFGGIPLRRKKNAVLTDRTPAPVAVRRKELVTRLQAGRCELCKRTGATVHAHHVRKLADLQRPGQPQPAWDRLMAKKRRKSLIVCVDCHAAIHDGRPTAIPTQ
jgi:group II intron reverse transcriptase/maturase